MRTLYKWLFGIIIVLTLLLAALQWMVEPWLERKAHDLLTNSKSFCGEAQQIEVNVFRRAIRLDSLEVQFQSSAKEDTSNNSNRFDLYTPSLNIAGIGILAYLFQNKVVVSKLHSENIQLRGLKKANSLKPANPSDRSGEQPLQGLRIRQFQLDSLSISFLDSVNGRQTDATVQLLAGGVELKTGEGGNFNFHPENTELIVEYSNVRLPSGYYELSLKKGHLSGGLSKLSLDSLSIQPLYKKYEFSQNYGYRTDHIMGSLGSLKSSGLDVASLLNKGDINADLMEFQGLSFDVFRDTRLPFHPDKHEVLLQNKLKQLPITLNIDSFQIEQGIIRYEEKRLDQQGTGELLLEDISMTGGELTNDSVRMEDVVFTAKGSATFMGSGKMEAEFNFPLGRENGYHRISGKLGPMSIPEVNPLLYPLTNFLVKKGYNENAYFDMELDNFHADGKVRFYYRDLHIEVKSRKRSWISDIKNYVANRIVINDNPQDDEFRIGHINYPRDTKRSMFNYWWMALRSGLLESVGLSKEVLK